MGRVQSSAVRYEFVSANVAMVSESRESHVLTTSFPFFFDVSGQSPGACIPAPATLTVPAKNRPFVGSNICKTKFAAVLARLFHCVAADELPLATSAWASRLNAAKV